MTISKSGKKTPWEILEDYPPALVRLLARKQFSPKHVRAMSDQEIAVGAELPVSEVRKISRMTSWDNIYMSKIKSFCSGCNFDPFDCYDRNRARAYTRSSAKFSYLKQSNLWQDTFLPLIKVLENAKKS
jgi:hypothetical protein